MAGDFNKPSGTSSRTNFMTEIRDWFVDSAKMFSGTSTTNYPDGCIRYNSSTKKFEKYSSGGASWSTLDITGTDAGSVLTKVPAAASGLATLSAGSLVVQDPANATATPTALKIPIAGADGTLDPSWSVSKFTSQNIISPVSRSVGSTYKNTSGRTMFVVATVYSTSPADFSVRVKSSSPADTVVCGVSSASTAWAMVCFIVPSNYYYKVSASAGTPSTAYWTEWY